jgi:hypothetical protein
VSWLAQAADPVVNQSAREVPVAASVDVVVVGGSTGAVSAAVAAAKTGAKVFLVAPRSYLGDDMTATLRLWLEDGERPESPLAKEIFDDRQAGLDQPDPNRIPFTYTADRPSAERHPDTKTPSLLADFVWGDATSQSVQFDDDVNLVLDLGATKDVARVRVHAYHQMTGPGYRDEQRQEPVAAGRGDREQPHVGRNVDRACGSAGGQGALPAAVVPQGAGRHAHAAGRD